MTFPEIVFLDFANKLTSKIFAEVRHYYLLKLLSGNATIDYLSNEDNMKQEHKIDRFVKNIVLDEFSGSSLNSTCTIYMEDYYHNKSIENPFSLFVDPVDGSRSADQRIGDPCFAFGWSDLPLSKTRFNDLKGCFIKALHSGDVYFTYLQKAYFVPCGLAFRIEGDQVFVDNTVLNPICLSTSEIKKLEDAVVIIRDGYGMRNIVESKINHSVLNFVKHTFSYDITVLELCYLAAARDIVHLIVEARKHYKGEKLIGSDGFNLIPYPLIKAVGGMIYDLCGKSYDEQSYDPFGIYDFIASTNNCIKEDFIQRGLKNEDF